MGLEELAGVIITRATNSVELAAQNLANMTTAGYKAKRLFLPMVEVTPGVAGDLRIDGRAPGMSVDFSAGKLQNTGNPLDFAISGSGFFTVQSAGSVLYTRAGQFRRDDDGHLVTSSGAALQSVNGDIVVDSGDFTVLADGTIQQAGQPVAQIAVVDFDDKSILQFAGNGLFSVPVGSTARDVPAPQIRQGAIETSNVSTADEMTSLMVALRSAETGQRVVQIYDELMGQALTTFGQM